MLNEILDGSQTPVSLEFCQYTLYCIAQGISDIHQLSKVHSAISLDKCFVDSQNGTVKIADLFGVSQVSKEANGTPKHNLLQKDLSDLAEIARQLSRRIQEQPEDTYNLGTSGVPHQVQEFITSCLTPSESDNPVLTIEQVLQTPFMQSAAEHRETWKQEVLTLSFEASQR